MIFLRNRETLPPWDNDVSIEGINITSSSEQTSGNYTLSFGNLRQLSTPPCSTYQNNLLPTTWKWYSEEVFNVGCMYNKELLVNLSFICIMSQVYFISASLKCVENLWLRLLKVTHNYFERDVGKKRKLVATATKGIVGNSLTSPFLDLRISGKFEKRALLWEMLQVYWTYLFGWIITFNW